MSEPTIREEGEEEVEQEVLPSKTITPVTSSSSSAEEGLSSPSAQMASRVEKLLEEVSAARAAAEAAGAEASRALDATDAVARAAQAAAADAAAAAAEAAAAAASGPERARKIEEAVRLRLTHKLLDAEARLLAASPDAGPQLLRMSEATDRAARGWGGGGQGERAGAAAAALALHGGMPGSPPEGGAGELTPRRAAYPGAVALAKQASDEDGREEGMSPETRDRISRQDTPERNVFFRVLSEQAAERQKQAGGGWGSGGGGGDGGGEGAKRGSVGALVAELEASPPASPGGAPKTSPTGKWAAPSGARAHEAAEQGETGRNGAPGAPRDAAAPAEKGAIVKDPLEGPKAVLEGLTEGLRKGLSAVKVQPAGFLACCSVRQKPPPMVAVKPASPRALPKPERLTGI